MPLRTKDKKVQMLKRVPLFGSCSSSSLSQIGRIADEIRLTEGRELISEGAPGRQFFILLAGTADVLRKGRKIATMRAGDFFGEISLLTDRPATATIKLTEDAALLVITRAGFRRLLRENSGVNLQVLQALAERVPIDY